ncbi:hypothetical protein [uncultured Hymenobacter sp.]|uniref:hypothetical protein n=1 Tax=uncultured Hymenobacter sp. TaxID=170016 RepID=UPI0035C9531A
MRLSLPLLTLLTVAAAGAHAQTPPLPPDTLHVSEAAARVQFLADTLYARAHYNKLEPSASPGRSSRRSGTNS